MHALEVFCCITHTNRITDPSQVGISSYWVNINVIRFSLDDLKVPVSCAALRTSSN